MVKYGNLTLFQACLFFICSGLFGWCLAGVWLGTLYSIGPLPYHSFEATFWLALFVTHLDAMVFLRASCAHFTNAVFGGRRAMDTR